MATPEQLGRAILDGMPRQAPSLFRKDYWNGKIMDWSMRDEAFKVEMFRFVDVFPVLRTPEQLAQHLQEYFCRPDQDFPAWIQLGLKSVSATSIVARAAAGQIEKNIRAMAAGFVAGEDAAAALPPLRALRSQGLGFTVDLLGEATVSEPEADRYAAQYAALIDALGDASAGLPADAILDQDDTGVLPRVNVSVKVSALYSQIDPIDPQGSIRGVRARLVPLLARARARGAFVNLDMEQYALRDVTERLFMDVGSDREVASDHLGMVVQAYLRDALESAERVVDWARHSGRRVTVRLVKGAYWDYETIHAQQMGWPIPVFQAKWETDRNFERIAAYLIDNHRWVRTAIASHNVRSIAAALSHAEARGLPKSAVEVQMLFGMAEPLKQSLRSMGYRLRDYVPVGALVPGMAYLVRRLLENTSNEGFLRAKFVDERDAADLVRVPSGAPAADPTPETPFVNEPHSDFSQARVREAFQAALRSVRVELGAHYPVRIDGEAVSTDRVIRSENPALRGEVAGTVGCATIALADRAMRAAYAAFPAWRDADPSARSAAIRRVAVELARRRFELAAWMVLEVGKSWREADADVAEAVDFCRYYADQADAMMAPERLGRIPGEHNLLHVQPLGVGVVIAPWNFPLAILTGMTVAGLVTGNCVLIKPAEQSSVIAAKLVECLIAAQLPRGVFAFLPGYGEEVGAHLVRHPWTRFVAFTGSREVGLDILRAAYDTQPTQPGPRRVICEMGGKNAIIVDGDADLDESVAAVIGSAFGFQGQKCSACSRVIVLPENYAAFVDRLVEGTRSLQVGPPEDPAFVFGPVIDDDARRRVERAINLGQTEGRPLLVTTARGEGSYAPFAVFEDIEVAHRLAQEEVFGPVLAVLRARDFSQAIEIANATSYALTAGVMSRSPKNLERARRELRVGNLYLNRGCTGALVHRQPFGGFKFSGLGTKAGGPHTLRQFVEERAVTENTMRRGFAPD